MYRQFDALRESLRAELKVSEAVLDGEIVCLDSTGQPCFMELLRRRGPPVYVAFVVLTVDAHDLRSQLLWRRKAQLRKLIPERAVSVPYADFVRGQGVALFAEACRRDLEGIVAKRRESLYDSARPWAKIRNPNYSQKEGRYELVPEDERSTMIRTETVPTIATPARELAAIFSNHTRCAWCRATHEIRVHYCPGCKLVNGEHFHRLCRCGAEWMERSAGHGGFVNLDNPHQVLVCQNCRTRVPVAQALEPRCCRRPEVSYHDLRDPCDLCRKRA